MCALSVLLFYMSVLIKHLPEIFFCKVFTLQLLRAVQLLFSPMVSRWMGGGKILIRAVSQKP